MYSVRTFLTRGYPSFTYVQRMASYILRRLKGKPTIILYFGDFDPSGFDIERDLDPNVLQRILAEAVEDYIDEDACIRRLKEIDGLKRWIKEKLRDIESLTLE